MTIQISFDMRFEFFAYVATGIQGTPPKGGRVGFPLLVVLHFGSFEEPWVYYGPFDLGPRQVRHHQRTSTVFVHLVNLESYRFCRGEGFCVPCSSRSPFTVCSLFLHSHGVGRYFRKIG